MAHFRRWLPPLALALGSFAVTLIFAEGIARLVWRPTSLGTRSAPHAAGDLPVLESVRDLARPNVRGVYKGVVFETNRWGFRGPDVPRRKPPGTFRIVVVGDSIAMGQGVAYQDTYSARVGRALAQSRAHVRIETLDLGLAGLNVFGVLERLEKVGLPLQPDLVVYGFTLNDIRGPAYRQFPGDYQTQRAIRLALSSRSPSYLWRLLEPRFVSLRELVAPPLGSYVYTLNQNYFHNPAAWRDLELALEHLAEGTRSLGICTHVLIHTKLYYLHLLHPFRRHYEAVAEAARERGLTATVTFPWFRGRDAPSLWVNAIDSHPNAEGHRLLAEALEAGLAELPESCRWGAKGGSVR
jgi:lysophospholipase L1-like esterase